MTQDNLPFLARRDLAGILDYYLAEAGPALAGRFMAELEATLRFIREFPGAGSPRYASVGGRANLRFRKLKRFPILVFYDTTGGVTVILRILHGARDIPASLRGLE